MDRMSKSSAKRKVEDYRDSEIWEIIKDAYGTIPQDINGLCNINSAYQQWELIKLAKGRFDINCPDWWDKDFMLDNLIYRGYFFVTDTPIGVMPIDGAVEGVNVFSRPSRLTTTNPIYAVSGLRRVLTGQNAQRESTAVGVYLFGSSYMGGGLMQMINHYAYKLASLDCSIDVASLNSRVAFIFNADDSKTAAEAKDVYSQISSGKPAVFTKVANPLDPDKGGLQIEAVPVKNNYILNDLIEARRNILNDFLAELGVNSTPHEKKERLVVDEVNSNNEEIEARVQYMSDNMELCSKKVRNTFGIEFDIKLKKEEDKVVENEQTNTDKETNV